MNLPITTPDSILHGTARCSRAFVGQTGPTRIAFCITDLDPGGAEKNLCQLVLGLPAERWKPAVYSLQPAGALSEVLASRGIPVYSMEARHRWDARAVLRLARCLSRFRPRLLQTFLFHANVAGRIAGRLAGVPVIVSGVRVAERRYRWPLLVETLTRPLADHAVCVSGGVQAWLRRASHWPVSRLSTIANALPDATFASVPPADLRSLALPRDARCILFVGRLDVQKGLTYLFDALAELCPRFPWLHLLLAGDGPARDALQRQAAECRLIGRVHFLGFRDDVPALMKCAEMFVLPSLWEGMPNVVLEAMAAGLPVVMTAVEGAAELIVDGRTGRVVPAGDAAALASVLTQGLQHPADLRRMAERAHDLAGRFTVPRMIAAYEALYDRLLRRSPFV